MILLHSPLLRILTISALITVLAAQNVSAQEIPAQLSLTRAVEIALSVNAKLEQARRSYDASISEEQIAGLRTSYELGNSTTFDRENGDSALSNRLFGSMSFDALRGTTSSIRVSPFTTGDDVGSVQISLRKPLTKRMGMLSEKADRVLSTRAATSIQNRQLFVVKQATILDVITQYYQAVLAMEQVAIQEKELALSEKLAEIMKKRAAAELVRKFEASQAQVAVARDRNRLNTSKQQAKGDVERLMLAMGTGVGTSPQLVDGIPKVDDLVITGLGDAMKLALKNRAEMDIAEKRISEQGRALAIATDEIRPGMDLVAGYNSSSSSSGLLPGSLLDSGAFTLGLEYSFSIDRRVERIRKNEAQQQLEILDKLRIYQMESIAEQVRSAHRNVDSARTSLQILSQNLEVARENLRLAERMVEEDLGTTRDVLEAQRSLADVESGMLSARVNMYLAAINLKYAMGEDLSSTLEI